MDINNNYGFLELDPLFNKRETDASARQRPALEDNDHAMQLAISNSIADTQKRQRRRRRQLGQPLTASRATKRKASTSSVAAAAAVFCTACTDPIAGLVHTSSCSHAYCTPCLTLLTQHSLNGETGSFPPTCCTQRIPTAIIRTAVPAELFTRYRNRIEEVAAGPNAIFCPNPRCALVIRPGCVHCGNCNTAVCTSCRKTAHPDRPCTKDANDLMLEQLIINKGWKKCPQCQTAVDKVYESCNHIRCKCGAQWCWVCKKGWEPRECKCHVWDSAAYAAVVENEKRGRLVLPVELDREEEEEPIQVPGEAGQLFDNDDDDDDGDDGDVAYMELLEELRPQRLPENEPPPLRPSRPSQPFARPIPEHRRPFIQGFPSDEQMGFPPMANINILQAAQQVRRARIPSPPPEPLLPNQYMFGDHLMGWSPLAAYPRSNVILPPSDVGGTLRPANQFQQPLPPHPPHPPPPPLANNLEARNILENRARRLRQRVIARVPPPRIGITRPHPLLLRHQLQAPQHPVVQGAQPFEFLGRPPIIASSAPVPRGADRDLAPLRHRPRARLDIFEHAAPNVFYGDVRLEQPPPPQQLQLQPQPQDNMAAAREDRGMGGLQEDEMDRGRRGNDWDIFGSGTYWF